ncbi:MAG: haloacid dehalogenase-like hydrolase [Magnetococcales bacterium]|nr:haloacid dehalogenase-like hydrolase [Magnetococcales bacterium]
MHIGLDFDNTLVTYDSLFFRLAQEQRFLPSECVPPANPSKNWVRQVVRDWGGGEIAWQKIQAEVYGPRMSEALLMPGVSDFLSTATERGARCFIISHKTTFARQDIRGEYNLHKAALDWMESHDFFNRDGFNFSLEDIFFNPTRAGKIAQIGRSSCDYFIDDLVEVLTEPGFPKQTRRLLLDPEGSAPPGPYRPMSSWAAIQRAIFGVHSIRS